MPSGRRSSRWSRPRAAPIRWVATGGGSRTECVLRSDAGPAGDGYWWVVAEQLCDRLVSDTTLLARRDEWITARAFDAVAEEDRPFA